DDKVFYKQCLSNIEQVARDFKWEKVCRPIINFCKDPVSNAEKSGINENNSVEMASSYNSQKSSKPARYLIKRFFYHLRSEGFKKTIKYSSNYLKERK
ncbi:unnamed protein product, partial [marine sediment metagenome]